MEKKNPTKIVQININNFFLLLKLFVFNKNSFHIYCKFHYKGIIYA